MLRINTIHRGSETILKVEGKLLQPWLEEFQLACARVEIQSGQVGLDLSDLSYADGAGTRLLRHLVQRAVPITACSAFVAELLREPQNQP